MFLYETETFMKKPILLTFLLIFVLSSCTGTSTADLLDYQSSGAEVSGILRTDTKDVQLSVTLSPMDDTASVRDAVLTFTYGSGTHSASVENGKVTLSADGLTIPIGETAGEYFLSLTSLFSIDGSTLYSVTAEDDGTVKAAFGDVASGTDVTVTFDPLTSLPRKISSETQSIIYEIDEYRLKDSDG